jgi:YD repeat-containing protein
MTDAKGIITRYEYNNAGELKKLIRNDGKQAVVYTYQYDAHDNLIKLLDAKGNETKRDYDFLDRPVVLTYDDGKQLQYARDNNGNLISRTDPNGTVVTNSYDELNRLTQRDIQH